MRPEAESLVRPSPVYVALVSEQAATRRMRPIRLGTGLVLGTMTLVSALVVGCGSGPSTPGQSGAIGSTLVSIGRNDPFSSRRCPISRKERQLSMAAFLLVKYCDSPLPSQALAIVEFT